MAAADGSGSVLRPQRVVKPSLKLADGTNSEPPLLVNHQKSLHWQEQQRGQASPRAGTNTPAKSPNTVALENTEHAAHGTSSPSRAATCTDADENDDEVEVVARSKVLS